MTGTILNIITVLTGGVLGMIFGGRLPERIQKTVVAGLGLFTTAIGVKMFTSSANEIIVLGAILVGGVLGEWWQIEERLRNLGGWLEHRFSSRPRVEISPGGDAGVKPNILSDRERFIQGFLASSLMFCVGPMTILGSIQDGLTGDYKLLAIKSVLDGFAALAFASTFGVGVLFSTLVILVYQGGLSLLAAQVQAIVTPEMMNEMTAAGGLLLLGIAFSSLLEIKQIRVGNFLPALVIAPVIVAILALF